MTVTPRLVGLPPVIARGTRLVVLGSFPGVASLQVGQYYAHPRNQFWPLLSQLLGEPLPALPYRECVARLRDRGAGLWDVYASCRREGSLDSAIEAAQLNDVASLRRRGPGMRAVAHNGGESARHRRHTEVLGLPLRAIAGGTRAEAMRSGVRRDVPEN
jgi:hypoxanthine-DNA glycosylase